MSLPDAAAAVAAAVAGAGEDLTYGVLALGDADVALPLSALREVVPCPASFDGLPVEVPGLLGAMTVRELVVPVVDLRAHAGLAGTRPADEIVVLVAQDERVVGVVADGTRDILVVPDADLRAVQADGPLLFTATFRHPGWGGVVSVLDVPALLRLPGVPTAHDPARGGASAVGSEAEVQARAARAARAAAFAAAGERRTLTVVRCGAHLLGIDVEHVHTTLARTEARPSALDGELCLGVTAYRGMQAPVVDPLALLGLGALERGDAPSGLVLDLGEGFAVLALCDLVDIVDLDAAAVLPLPGFSVRRPDLVTGITRLEAEGDCLVLDGAALHADPQLRNFGALNLPVAEAAGGLGPGVGAGGSGGASGAGGAGGAGARVFLTYSLGEQDVATPLEQVQEIVAFSEPGTATAVGDAVLGVVVHRELAVPVLCLPTLLGLERPAAGEQACLLLVDVGGEHVGFAVAALRALDPLVWEEQEKAGPPADLGSALRGAPLIEVGETPRLLPELDLVAIGRLARERIAGGASCAVAPAVAPPVALAA